jgi:hypothetical protein
VGAASADFSDRLLVRLVGAAYPLVIEPTSGELPVTLFWQATSQMVDDYEVVLHLVDDSRRVWGNGTARPNDWAYPTTFWQSGLETIAAQQKVVLETDTLDPGRYWLAVALFNPATGQRLPLREGASDSADTFFIGSLHAEAGVDCSHRGGNPGFVRVLDERRLAFPDYSGNNMFQTLGNLSVDPRAGLLFLNFETGDTLQLTGTTDIIWDQARLRDWPGAQRLIEFEVSKTIEARGASPMRWRLMDYAASNPR